MMCKKGIDSQSSSAILRSKQFLMINSCFANHNTPRVHLFPLNYNVFPFTCIFSHAIPSEASWGDVRSLWMSGKTMNLQITMKPAATLQITPPRF